MNAFDKYMIAKSAVPIGTVVEMKIGGESNTRYRRVHNYKEYNNAFYLCYKIEKNEVFPCTGAEAMAAGDAGFRLDFAPEVPQWRANSPTPSGNPLALMNDALQNQVEL